MNLLPLNHNLSNMNKNLTCSKGRRDLHAAVCLILSVSFIRFRNTSFGTL